MKLGIEVAAAEGSYQLGAISNKTEAFSCKEILNMSHAFRENSCNHISRALGGIVTR